MFVRVHLGDKVHRMYFFAVSYFVRVYKKYHDLLRYTWFVFRRSYYVFWVTL